MSFSHLVMIQIYLKCLNDYFKCLNVFQSSCDDIEMMSPDTKSEDEDHSCVSTYDTDNESKYSQEFIKRNKKG